MFRSIRFQATIIAFTFAVVPILIVSGIIAQRSFTSLEDEAIVRQQQEADIAAGEIAAFVNERFNQLQWLIEVRGLASLDIEEQRVLLNSLLSYETTFRELALLDTSGQETMRVSRRQIFLDEDLESRANTLSYQNAIAGDIFVSDVQIDDLVREPFVTIALPVTNAANTGIPYVLVAELRFRPVWDLIDDLQGGGDNSTDIYVTDTSGLLLAHANPSLVLDERRVDLPGENGSATGLGGNEVIFAKQPLSFGTLELFVISERDSDAALSLATANLRTSIITMIVAVILVTGAVVWLMGRFVRPILKLSAVAQEISQGNLAAEAEVRGRNEIAVLAKSFNDMTARLRSLIANLEKRVDERTKELALAKVELEAALAKALEADQLKSQFLASMSHELRTPLNSILTFSELMEMGTFGDVTAEQQDYLQKILFSGRHLLALINDVLDITKIQSGMLKLFIEEDFDIQREMDNIASTAHNTLGDKAVKLVMDVDEELGTMTCDKRRIRQVLLNLMSNAVKFTEEGSITISAKKRDHEVLFAVIDTGPGIPLDQQELIFQPFIQTETGIKHAGGTGLGLPISKQLVEAHGGKLWVESQPGEGAAFFVRIPLKNSPQTEVIVEMETV